ncbi:MAG: LPS export ABC transporter permease LptF [Halioglobus sp.]
MKLLRYLNREVLTHMVAVSAILLVIIISGRFVKYLAEAAVGDIAANILLPVMLYRMPGFLELIIPLGLFIGILMSYGRLYVESEMVIFSACGISPTRLAGYTMVPAGVVMLIVAGLSLYITPLGAARSQALLDDPRSSQGLNALTAGRFQTQSKASLVSYAESVEAETGIMKSVFLSQRDEDSDGKPTMMVTVAEEGEIIVDEESGARYLELRNGYRYQGVPGQLEYQVVRFERFGELIPEPKDSIRTVYPVDGRSTRALLASDSAEDIAALQWRLSLPMTVPIVAIIALTLSRTDHRRGRYVKMAPAFLIYLSYLMLLTNARAEIEKGEAALFPGMWGIHLLFLSLALVLLFGPDIVRRLKYWRYLRAQA